MASLVASGESGEFFPIPSDSTSLCGGELRNRATTRHSPLVSVADLFPAQSAVRNLTAQPRRQCMASEVIPFGKYKGQPVEAMAADQQYIEWLMGQSWFRDRYQNIYTLVVNNFTEPSETPEHNALQTRFLDAPFAIATARALGLDKTLMEELRKRLLVNISYREKRRERLIRKLIQDTVDKEDKHLFSSGLGLGHGGIYDFRDFRLNDRAEDVVPGNVPQWANQERLRAAADKLTEILAEAPHIRDLAASIDKPFGSSHDHLDPLGNEEATEETIAGMARRNDELAIIAEDLGGHVALSIHDLEFECDGWDVVFCCRADLASAVSAEISLRFELKASLGDDYPSVLRQMKANCRLGRDEPRNTFFVLVIGSFTAAGAALDQVREIFAASDFRIVLMSEIGSQR